MSSGSDMYAEYLAMKNASQAQPGPSGTDMYAEYQDMKSPQLSDFVGKRFPVMTEFDKQPGPKTLSEAVIADANKLAGGSLTPETDNPISNVDFPIGNTGLSIGRVGRNTARSGVRIALAVIPSFVDAAMHPVDAVTGIAHQIALVPTATSPSDPDYQKARNEINLDPLGPAAAAGAVYGGLEGIAGLGSKLMAPKSVPEASPTLTEAPTEPIAPPEKLTASDTSPVPKVAPVEPMPPANPNFPVSGSDMYAEYQAMKGTTALESAPPPATAPAPEPSVPTGETPKVTLDSPVSLTRPEASPIADIADNLQTPVPSEPQGFTLNKESIAQLREGANLDALNPPTRKSFDQTLARAKQANLDESALDVAQEVIIDKRPLTDEEHVGMWLKAKEVAAGIQSNTVAWDKLSELGDQAGADAALNRIDGLTRDLDLLTRASDYGGTELGRGLGIRRLAEGDLGDPTVAIQRATRSAGRQLTPEETIRIQKLSSDYSKIFSEHEKLKSDFDASVADRAKLQAEKIARKENLKQIVTKKTAVRKASILDERLSLKKQIAAIGYRVNDITGATAEGSYLIGKLAINYIKEGAATLDEAVRKVLIDLPDLTKEDVWRGINATDPAKVAKLRSGIDQKVSQIKTQARLLSKIDDATKGIFDQSRSRPPEPLEIVNLRHTLGELRKAAFKSGNLDSAQLTRASKTINDLQSQLDGQFRNIKAKKAIPSAELQLLQNRIADLRKTMRLDDTLHSLHEQLRTGQYEIPKKAQKVELSPELARKQTEVSIARKKVRSAIADLKPLTTYQKALDIASIPRSLITTADVSYTLRQGFALSAPRPIVAGKIFGKALTTLFSKMNAEQIDAGIQNSPNKPFYDISGVKFNALPGDIGQRTEFFNSRMAERIPGWGAIVRGSDRNMVTGINLLRAATIDELVAKYPNATVPELKAWGTYVNRASGDGSLGSFAGAAKELSAVFFAPKFSMSRIQTPLMIFKYWKEPRIRTEIAKEYAAIVGSGMTALTLAHLAGAKVGYKPEDPDFGKIVIGNTRIDVWGGFLQPARLVARIGDLAAEKTTSSFTGTQLRKEMTKIDPLELIGRFALLKLNPVVSGAEELAVGHNVVGEKSTPMSMLAQAAIPMMFQDIYDAYKSGADVGGTAAAGAASALGVGISTYEKQYKGNMRTPPSPHPPRTAHP